MPPKGTPKKPVPEWAVGDLVLAKMKGFPPWPSMVEDPEAVQVKPQKNKVYVVFFGSASQTCFCTPTDITPFSLKLHDEMKAKPRLKPDLAQALKDIKVEYMWRCKNPGIGRRKAPAKGDRPKEFKLVTADGRPFAVASTDPVDCEAQPASDVLFTPAKDAAPTPATEAAATPDGADLRESAAGAEEAKTESAPADKEEAPEKVAEENAKGDGEADEKRDVSGAEAVEVKDLEEKVVQVAEIDTGKEAEKKAEDKGEEEPDEKGGESTLPSPLPVQADGVVDAEEAAEKPTIVEKLAEALEVEGATVEPPSGEAAVEPTVTGKRPREDEKAEELITAATECVRALKVRAGFTLEGSTELITKILREVYAAEETPVIATTTA
eukprot:TRINITY_DN17895_c0_g1_i1.p1 TRINITY_DN17895_c0_g1~~TRINITY_DN17895_c0_g1_i1.p1  ORF type:complete len:381 (-),score=91.95 TRINITY_DN17895_c0_g1_i1:30-1172(-)